MGAFVHFCLQGCGTPHVLETPEPEVHGNKTRQNLKEEWASQKEGHAASRKDLAAVLVL